jgi:predicted  nucleic acid-binding Zn-ribbon protein
MSDTDIHIVKCNVLNAVQSQEIIALKDRIIQLEEELMDAKNKYAALVADVVLYEDRGERIKRLEQTLEAVTDKLDNAWGIYMQFKEAKP